MKSLDFEEGITTEEDAPLPLPWKVYERKQLRGEEKQAHKRGVTEN